MNPKNSGTIVPSNTGFFKDMMIRIKLVYRLMTDRRVNLFLKLIPIAGLVYVIVPTDLMPLIPLDDAVVAWMALTLFVELSPDDVVEEHLSKMRTDATGKWKATQVEDPGVDEVIDAEFTIVNAQIHPLDEIPPEKKDELADV
jgi:uncharacterized membrane protein YkvA (DUF1232 family)